MTELPYSYHTFIFPFTWDNEQDKFTTNNSSEWKNLSPGSNWHLTNWDEGNKPPSATKSNNGEYLKDYASYQYFNSYARNLVFGIGENSLVRNYEYELNDNPITDIIGEYIIEHSNEKFKLAVRAIKLKLLSNGVGILYFELEYYGEKINDCTKESEFLRKDDNKTIKDVNKINEYGRRIMLPYIYKGKDKSHPLVADKITLKIYGKEEFGENYHNFKKINQEHLDGSDKLVFDDIPLFIKNLLNKINISPAIDDRMFVCCLLRDNTISKDIQEKNTEYSYLSQCHDKSENSISNILYTFAFIENTPTCQNANMKKDILEKSIYARWIDYGTIYGVTHHSLICVTSENETVLDPVIKPFVNQYVQMAIIALLQRVSLLRLSKMAGNTTNSFHGNGEISHREIQKVLQLHEEYVRCQNQILLFEVTSQEQGMELFEMFLEQLYIEREKNALETQLNNLYEIASGNYERLNLKQNKCLTWAIVIFTIILVFLSL